MQLEPLLCTTINATTHERFIPFHRRRVTGDSLPFWNSKLWVILLKRHMRLKNEPLVGQVELLYGNTPQPVCVCFRCPVGQEDAVSLRYLALAGCYSRHTSLSEGCHQNTSTGCEETEIWSPFEDYEESLISGPSNGDERVSEKGAYAPTNNSEDEQCNRRRLWKSSRIKSSSSVKAGRTSSCSWQTGQREIRQVSFYGQKLGWERQELYTIQRMRGLGTFFFFFFTFDPSG